MDGSEREHIRELREKGVCPNCEKLIAEGTGVAYGAGRFCNLDCVAEYNKQELLERAKRVSEIAGRHRNS
jgi:hypothetical protein